MADLKLAGMLNLSGDLVLRGDVGKVFANGFEVLVEAPSPNDPHSEQGIPVPLTGTSLIDAGTKVFVTKNFNSAVMIESAYVITMGITAQGDTPTWPGFVLPSVKNKSGEGIVTVNNIPINVKDDISITLPNGGTAKLTETHQR